ncbi:MAG: hypothetical protein ACRBN8_06085 [Nannocystales bacterium]
MGQANPLNIFAQLQRNQAAQPVQPAPPPVQAAAALGGGVNAINMQPPEVYYVIIGRGPMAVVNSTTLQADRSDDNRVEGKTIMHIGFPNPWPKYFQHGLGQPNHLLSFPGFDNDAMMTGPTKDSGLDSQHFGDRIDAEAERAKGAEGQTRERWVALIQRRPSQVGLPEGDFANEEGGDGVVGLVNVQAHRAWPAHPPGEAPYRLCLYDPSTGTAELVYASKIDICTGPGRPQVFPTAGQPAPNESDVIVAARTPPWISPENWTDEQKNRKVMNGVDAIRDEVSWHFTERICVTAGGGVGLNAAEKARDADCPADWFGRSGLTPILLNPRNRTFLQYPESHPHWAPHPPLVLPPFELGKRFELGDLYDGTGILETDQESNIFPAGVKGRMGKNASLNEVEFDEESNKVDVRLQSSGGARGTIRDFFQQERVLDEENGWWMYGGEYQMNVIYGLGDPNPTRLYSRLVIPNGQQSNTLGQPKSFARQLNFAPLQLENRMVGLQADNGRVRILGAASNNYPGQGIGDWQNGEALDAAAMWDYHDTLPKCAVPDGFIICAINTAVANGYFRSPPTPGHLPGRAIPETYNRNINTMTLREVQYLIRPDYAERIVFFRKELNGYENLRELIAVCIPTAGGDVRGMLEELRAAEAALREASGRVRAEDAALRAEQRTPRGASEAFIAASGIRRRRFNAVVGRRRRAVADATLRFGTFAADIRANREEMVTMMPDAEFGEYSESARYQALVNTRDTQHSMRFLAKLVREGKVRFSYPNR